MSGRGPLPVAQGKFISSGAWVSPLGSQGSAALLPPRRPTSVHPDRRTTFTVITRSPEELAVQNTPPRPIPPVQHTKAKAVIRHIVHSQNGYSLNHTTTTQPAMALPSSSRTSFPTFRQELPDGDLRKLLKARSPKKNGIKPGLKYSTPITPPVLTKTASSSKFDTSSPVYTKPSPLFHTVTPAPSSPSEPTNDLEEETLHCTTCKRRMAPGRWKTCLKCREKGRVQAQRKREKDRLEARKARSSSPSEYDPLPIEERFTAYMKQLREKGLIPSAGANGKRKAEEHDIRPGTKRLKIEGFEYQSAKDLYAKLEDLLRTRGMPQRFTGHFSVVSQRGGAATYEVKVEAQAMVDYAGLRLDLDPIRISTVGSEVDYKREVEYQCACSKTCSGRVMVSVQSVDTGLIPGRKVTLHIQH